MLTDTVSDKSASWPSCNGDGTQNPTGLSRGSVKTVQIGSQIQTVAFAIRVLLESREE